jgi:hypothetical protein
MYPRLRVCFSFSADVAGKRVILVAGSRMSGHNNGPALQSMFNGVCGLAAAPDKPVLYLADRHNHAIRVLHLDSMMVTTLAGAGNNGQIDGHASKATFDSPTQVVCDAAGHVFVLEENGVLRRLDIDTRKNSFSLECLSIFKLKCMSSRLTTLSLFLFLCSVQVTTVSLPVHLRALTFDPFGTMYAATAEHQIVRVDGVGACFVSINAPILNRSLLLSCFAVIVVLIACCQ